ncbi:hypothetical protein ACS18B_002807, partial [Enterococcus hirae]
QNFPYIFWTPLNFQIIVPLVVEQCGTQQKRERLSTTFKEVITVSLFMPLESSSQYENNIHYT